MPDGPVDPQVQYDHTPARVLRHAMMRNIVVETESGKLIAVKTVTLQVKVRDLILLHTTYN